jgi:hypothetical protein
VNQSVMELSGMVEWSDDWDWPLCGGQCVYEFSESHVTDSEEAPAKFSTVTVQ